MSMASMDALSTAIGSVEAKTPTSGRKGTNENPQQSQMGVISVATLIWRTRSLSKVSRTAFEAMARPFWKSGQPSVPTVMAPVGQASMQWRQKVQKWLSSWRSPFLSKAIAECSQASTHLLQWMHLSLCHLKDSVEQVMDSAAGLSGDGAHAEIFDGAAKAAHAVAFGVG